MSGKSKDFVLDEGLDDDDDMLAFHAARMAAAAASSPSTTHPHPSPPPPPPPPPSHPSVSTDNLPSHKSPDASSSSALNTLAQTRSNSDIGSSTQAITPGAHASPGSSQGKTEPELNTVLISNLPGNVTRSELDKFFSQEGNRSDKDTENVNTRSSTTGCTTTGCGMVRVQLERTVSALSARISFSTSEMASHALSLDGTELRAGVKLRIEKVSSHASDDSSGNASNVLSEALSNIHLKLEPALSAAGNALDGMDRQIGASKMLSAAGAAVKDLDRQTGASKKVGAVAGSVGKAVKVMVDEVDENFDVSGKARRATNRAMEDTGAVGNGVRTVVDKWLAFLAPSPHASSAPSARKRKNYQPANTPPPASASPPPPPPHPTSVTMAEAEQRRVRVNGDAGNVARKLDTDMEINEEQKGDLAAVKTIDMAELEFVKNEKEDSEREDVRKIGTDRIDNGRERQGVNGA